MWKLFNYLELYGKALKIVVKQHEDKPSKETEKTCIEILKCLGWKHVIRWNLLISYIILYFNFFLQISGVWKTRKISY